MPGSQATAPMLNRRQALLATTAAAWGTSLWPRVAAAAPAVGQAGPEISLTDVDGRPVRLSSFKGRHVVLEWTNPGCPFVRKHYNGGNLPGLQRDAMAKNVVWLAINSTEPGHSDYLQPAALKAWKTERQSTPTAVLMDPKGVAGRAYGARTTPHMYILNPQGVLIYAGAIDSIPSARADDIARATNHVRVALDEALAGKPVSVPTTNPYGCSIKYGVAA
jgi:hypothetical protein